MTKFTFQTLQDIRDEFEARRRNPLPDGWQPEETAPIGEKVLTFDDHYEMELAAKYSDGTWTITADYNGMIPSDWKPTHWMKLPAQPKQG